MAVYNLQITMFMTSGVGADAITNSWSCEADDNATAVGFVNEVITLYDGFRSHFPALVRQTNHEWKLYNRSDPVPRAPVSSGLWSFTTAPSGNPAPPEVSLCLSFQGPRVSGTPQARRRGRIYFGPLDVADIAATGRPTTTLVNDLRNAGNTLRLASVAAAGWDWTVHSPTTGQDVVVNNGWVDDEFDTQRRRGRLPEVRTVFP